MRRYVLVIIFYFTCVSSHAATQDAISLDVEHAPLVDVIQMVGKFIHANVIVSPTVRGMATLHLHEAEPKQAFKLLLRSHGLASWQAGNVVMVAPRSELLKSQQDAASWQTIQEKSEPLLLQTWQLNYAQAKAVKRILQDDQHPLLSKRGKISVDVRTNQLFARDTKVHLALIQQLVKQLDIPVKQILIETRLATVDSDYKRELGIQYLNETKSNPIITSHGFSLVVAKLADGSLLDVKLSALENAGHADLISTPSLLTANQQTASIEAGEEVPYQEVSESGGTAVTFKKAVLGLKVTPQLLPDNKVLLKLNINQDRPSSHLVLGVPTITTRQMTTNVLLKNGQTAVLGGIYETSNEHTEEGIPFLNKVPLVGELFKQRSTRQSKRELLIFVTPKLVE